MAELLPRVLLEGTSDMEWIMRIIP